MPNSPDLEPSTHNSDASLNALTAAKRVLYVFDDRGVIIGLTKEYKTYQTLQQAYLDAQSAYAMAYASATRNSSQLQAWPITSKSLQAVVDNAYSEWRSSDVAKIENAIEMVKRAGALK